MPPFYSPGSPPENDPIEDIGTSRNIKAQSAIKNTLDLEQRYLENYNHSTNAPKIARPGFLAGHHGPRNTLHLLPGSPIPPPEHIPKRKADRELALAHLHKRATGPRGISVETAADGSFEYQKRVVDKKGAAPHIKPLQLQQSRPLISDSEEVSEEGDISPHFQKKKGKTGAPQPSVTKNWSGPHDNAWSGNKQPPPTRVRRGLISQKDKSRSKQKSWPLLVFQRGTTVVDEGKSNDLRIVREGPDGAWKFVVRSSESEALFDFGSEDLGPVKGCQAIKTFAIEMKHKPPAGRYLMFTSKTEDDYKEIFDALNHACVGLDVPWEVTEERIQVFRKDFLARRTPKPSPTSLAVNDSRTRLQEAQDAKMARELQNGMRRTSGRQATKPKLYDAMKKPQTMEAVVVETSPKQKNTRLADNTPKLPNLRSSNAESASLEPRSVKVEKLKPPSVWKGPLVYPFEGAKRANVDYGDLERLNPEEFLNDNIINFYLRHLEERLRLTDPELSKETHFFNTFFYERLKKRSENDPQKGIECVLKWTSKIDLFAKNYVIIPINESSHWYLAIVCNLQHLDRKLMPTIDSEDRMDVDSDATIPDERRLSPKGGEVTVRAPSEKPVINIDEQDTAVSVAQSGVERMEIDEEDPEWPVDDENEALDPELEVKNQKAVFLSEAKSSTTKNKAKKSSRYLEPDTPAIIILDSMADTTSRRPTTLRNLREWLKAEAQRKRSIEVNTKEIYGVYPRSPNQNNWYDCGLYVLHYVEVFLDHAKDFIKSFLAKDDAEIMELWRQEEVIEMRRRLFKLIITLHGEYEEHELKKSGGKRPSPVPAMKAGSSPKIRSDRSTKTGSRSTSAGVNNKLSAADEAERTNDSASPEIQIIRESSAAAMDAKTTSSTKTRRGGSKTHNIPAQVRTSPRRFRTNTANVEKSLVEEIELEKQDVVEETPSSSAPSSPLSDVPSSVYGHDPVIKTVTDKVLTGVLGAGKVAVSSLARAWEGCENDDGEGKNVIPATPSPPPRDRSIEL